MVILKKDNFKNWINKCIVLQSSSGEFQKYGNHIANNISNFEDLNTISKIIFDLINIESDKDKYWNIICEIIDECYKDLRNNIYHTPIHIAQVATFSFILISKSGDIFDNKEKMLMLLAALGHDLCHDGTNHINEPFLLEQKAANKMRKIMSKYHFVENDIKQIQNLILMTDSSLRKTISMINSHEKDVIIPDFLKEASKKDFFLGGLLADADMFCSIGLGFKQHVKQTILVAKEISMFNKTSFNGVDPTIVSYFLNEIIGNKFCSVIGNDFLYSLENIKEEVSDSSKYSI